MAIVSLGSRVLRIGDSPSLFDPFAFNRRRAYGFFCNWQLNNFDNLFSYVEITALLSVPNIPPFLGDEVIRPIITSIPNMFFYPFSRLYDGNGTCQFRAERKSNIPGAGGVEPDLGLEITYDDNLDVPSWRD